MRMEQKSFSANFDTIFWVCGKKKYDIEAISNGRDNADSETQISKEKIRDL